MNVSAVIVTRGDVDLRPVLDSLPRAWEVILWDNRGVTTRQTPDTREVVFTIDSPDLSVYGRYAAIEYATNDLIFVVDDDVIVSDPQAIVDAWIETAKYPYDGRAPDAPSDPRDSVGHVVCNMPQEFRHDFYEDNALVGFGAAFHRDAPARAFARIGFDGRVSPFLEDDHTQIRYTSAFGVTVEFPDTAFVRRTCDIVFTGLTPTVLVDVPKTDREFASDPGRMWRQPDHVAERQRMRDLVRQVREA